MKQNQEIFINRSLALIAAIMLLCSQAPAQIHAPFQARHQWLVRAEEQFMQEHYHLAAASARRFLEGRDDHMPLSTQADELDRAGYYEAAGRLKAGSAGCADTALLFLRRTSNPVYRQRTAVALARYYFLNDRLAEAIPWYETAGIANLSNREIADAKFELAYCYFNVRKFELAEPLFANIREIPGRYFDPGNYYYGLLSYHRGDYENALKSFKRIASLPEYKSIVPYYIAEIHYFLGRRDKALAEAQRLMRLPDKLYYDRELHLLAAQCLFEQEDYKEALPYFEYFYENSTKIRKEELYEMAYCYYQVNDYQKAIRDFRQLSNERDSLGQTAMYLLGDCYLRTGDRNSARNAFGICADMDYNPRQQEAALLLAGKLAYEMGYNDEASGRLRQLLELYPQSVFSTEARTLFSDLLARTNNYEAAYQNIRDIGQGGEDYNRVFQKVSYGYAMQQLQSGELQKAYLLLENSLNYPADKAYLAVTGFWLSELAYRMQQYEATLRFGEIFLDNGNQPERIAYLSPAANPQHAYMNMGYAAMKLEKFELAQTCFGKARESAGDMKMNAILREADAAFMRKQFVQAAVLYDKAIATGKPSDVDYAKLQKGILLGLQQKNAEKVALLQSVVGQPGASPYISEARYELAVAYLDDNKFRQAIETLQPLTTGSDTRKAPAAWLKIGFARQELKEDDLAIEAYRRIVTGYPAAEERTAALEALKNLYIQHNQPGAYARLLGEQNLPDEDEHSLDSTYYAAAEARYAAGKYVEAKAAMAEYLERYPNGLFTLKAHFYKAESHYQLNEYPEAIAGYEAVLDAPWSDFSELSALRAAGIAVRQEDYIMAYRHYLSLRNNAMSPENLRIAYAGLTKSSYKQSWLSETVQYADTLMSLPGVTEAEMTEARFFKAKALAQQGGSEQALMLFRQLGTARNGAVAAESRYMVAEIYLGQNKLKEAEKAANETIKQSGGNDYWIVKSYILLGDLLARQKDYFNAKAALQSIVKNSKITELREEAARKLEEVKALERKQSKLED